MKKLLILTSAVCIGLAGNAVAKNNPDPLADVLPGGCSFAQIAPFGTSLLASWDWENGELQTKFGGDAEFWVVAETIDQSFEGEIEFELEQYEPGTPADAYPGVLVYRCSNPVSDPAGSCNGSVLGVRDAIRQAVADELGVLPEDITELSASLEGVKVKAMNPGSKGRQNYELVDVCELPDV